MDVGWRRLRNAPAKFTALRKPSCSCSCRQAAREEERRRKRRTRREREKDNRGGARHSYSAARFTGSWQWQLSRPEPPTSSWKRPTRRGTGACFGRPGAENLGARGKHMTHTLFIALELWEWRPAVVTVTAPRGLHSSAAGTCHSFAPFSSLLYSLWAVPACHIFVHWLLPTGVTIICHQRSPRTAHL